MEIKKTIKLLLIQYPELRDNDNKLLSYIWQYECQHTNFFKALENHQLTSSESITRLRRMLQMEYPELRGKKYIERHNKQEKVKNDLGYKAKQK